MGGGRWRHSGDSRDEWSRRNEQDTQRYARWQYTLRACVDELRVNHRLEEIYGGRIVDCAAGAFEFECSSRAERWSVAEDVDGTAIGVGETEMLLEMAAEVIQ